MPLEDHELRTSESAAAPPPGAFNLPPQFPGLGGGTKLPGLGGGFNPFGGKKK